MLLVVVYVVWLIRKETEKHIKLQGEKDEERSQDTGS